MEVISFYTFNSSYLNFVFSLSEDGPIVGQNIYEVNVYINKFQHTWVHLFVLFFYIFK